MRNSHSSSGRDGENDALGPSLRVPPKPMRLKRRVRQIVAGGAFLALIFFALVSPPFHNAHAAWIARGVFLLLLTYGALIEPNRLRVLRHQVPLATLDPALDGFTLVHLSDLHWGNLGVTRHLLRRAVRAANEAHADLAVLTGDLIARKPNRLPEVIELLRGLKATHGVFAVAGNQDRRALPDLKPSLASVGIRLLENECAAVHTGGTSLWLVGCSDPSSDRDDLRGALERADAATEPVLLLAHSPDIASELHTHPIPLILVGHTHGGQIGWPPAAKLARPCRDGRRYVAGWYWVGKARMYVNRGVGHMYPFRFLCPPEIAVFVLQRP